MTISTHTVRHRLHQSCDEKGFVSKEFAERLISSSAIWLTHRHGPCDAPGHAKRVRGREGNWHITFGANTFYISLAVRHFKMAVEKSLSEIEAGRMIILSQLKDQLRGIMQSTIGNHSLDLYIQFPMQGSNLVFGATAINVYYFINSYLSQVQFIQLLEEQ